MKYEYVVDSGTPITIEQALILGIMALEGGKMKKDALKAEFVDRVFRHGSVEAAAAAVFAELHPPADTQGFAP